MKIEYNNLNIPESFSEKFFTKVLENVYGDGIAEIKEINFTLGSGGGENYLSDIYRAKVAFITNTGNLRKISLIIKSIPQVETNTQLQHMNVYCKEKIMYFDVLPTVEEISKGCKFSPKCFYTETEPIHCIVFEDLKPLGYQMQDRVTGMDKVHAKLVLKKLGKYHASTMVYIKQHPELLSNFKNGIIILDEELNSNQRYWANGNLQLASEMAREWPGYESICEKLNKILDTFGQRIEYLMAHESGDINVLNHGDLWLNNMMFKYDAEEPTDVLFIDYQLCMLKSPGFDLHYFLTTSVQLKILENCKDELLECYYDSLSSTLEEIDYEKIPTFDDIKKELIRTMFYSFYTALIVLPIISMDRESSKDNSLDNFADEDFVSKQKKIMFSSERMQLTLKYMLKAVNENGFLDKLINVPL